MLRHPDGPEEVSASRAVRIAMHTARTLGQRIVAMDGAALTAELIRENGALLARLDRAQALEAPACITPPGC